MNDDDNFSHLKRPRHPMPDFMRQALPKFLILVALTACKESSFVSGTTTSQLTPTEISTPLLIPANTEVPQDIAITETIMTPTVAQMPSPSASTTRFPTLDWSTLPSGLIYWIPGDGSTWQINDAGEPTSQINWGPPLLSSDGRYQFLPERWAFDISIFDKNTGEMFKIEADSDQSISNPQWWPAKPDIIVFELWNTNPSGYLGAVTIDGSDFRVLDETSDLLPGGFALNPTGQNIAYTHAIGGKPWLYEWAGDSSFPFDLSAYGFLETFRFFSSPAWSSDGTELAWTVAGDIGNGPQQGVAVFNLNTKTYQLSPFFDPAPYSGPGSLAAVWSPDDKWLSFVLSSENESEHGLWIINPVGEPVLFLKESGEPIWSPDGHWLISPFRGPIFNGSAGPRYLIEVGTWEIFESTLPFDAELIAWPEIEE